MLAAAKVEVQAVASGLPTQLLSPEELAELLKTWKRVACSWLRIPPAFVSPVTDGRVRVADSHDRIGVSSLRTLRTTPIVCRSVNSSFLSFQRSAKQLRC
jgi:hypothetical protein